MFDMMLLPLGEQAWTGSNSTAPRARFHYDWSRVAFLAGAQVDPLYCFSYGIGDQQPAAITAAIGATQADQFDTSITKANTLSRTCLATHMGVTVDRVTLIQAAAADAVGTLANLRVGLSRIAVRLYYAIREWEEVTGTIEDFPEGIGLITTDKTAGTYLGQFNGTPLMSNIKPLPRPLPFKGGETYLRVVMEPSVRDGGCTHIAVVQAYTARIYGVAPPKVQPSEAPRKAMQQLAALQAQVG